MREHSAIIFKEKKIGAFARAWLLVMPLALVLLGICVVLARPIRVGAESTMTHGTAEKTISEKQLKLTPPEDYEVDMSMQADAKDGAYNEYFLKDKLQTVKIKIDENNLNYMLQKAGSKPSVMTESVTIGDKTIGYTGLKTKGSYTLDHAVTENAGSDRFSFTVNFGKYIKKENYGVKQNFYGCRKISFNNFFFDKTMMKEYVSWVILSEMGLPTPQFGLTRLYINDEYYGVYFMVESLDQSILEQYWDVKKKDVGDYLLKPENTRLTYHEEMDKYLKEDGTFDFGSDLKLGKDGLYKVSGVLADQEAIWEFDDDSLQDVAEMLPTFFLWQKRINQLSKGTDFEGKKIDVNSDEYLELLNQIMDVDEVVKYFATHSFLVQNDNMFTGTKNYGLYVGFDGKCMVVPWDYDLSFGCFYPSTAEATANLSLDVMFRKEIFDRNGLTTVNEDEVYSEYPLFNVIYQNESLMKKYHEYMRECSKIAVLGGTTFTGKSYDPGLLYKLIQGVREPLIEAASEKVTDNVYYMNFINQPSGVKLGLPNLAKIIAMRSVGVLEQVDGVDATVCGYGCNLETLGNGAVGESSVSGRLTAVDERTGIFVTAMYGLKGKTEKGPLGHIHREEIFNKIRRKVGCGDSELAVYDVTNTADAEDGKYTVSVPVSMDFAKKGAEVYVYTKDGKVKKMDAAVDDNLYTITTDSFRYIAVAKKGSVAIRTWRNPVPHIVVIVLLIGVFLFFWFKPSIKSAKKKREALKKKI